MDRRVVGLVGIDHFTTTGGFKVFHGDLECRRRIRAEADKGEADKGRG